MSGEGAALGAFWFIDQDGNGAHHLLRDDWRTNATAVPFIRDFFPAQQIVAAAFSDSDTFPGATITQPGAGSQTITAAFFDDSADTFPPATLTSTAAIIAATFTDADTFHSATVSAVNSIIAAAFTDGDTFPSATVSATYTINAAAFADSDTFPGAIVSQPGAQAIVAGGFVDGDTFPPAVVSTGQVVTIRGDDAFGSSGARERFWRKRAEDWLQENLPELQDAISAPKRERKRIARDFLAAVPETNDSELRPVLTAAANIARALLAPAPDYTALAMQVAHEMALVEQAKAKRRRQRDAEAILLLVA